MTVPVSPCGCLFLILISPMILGNGWMSGGRVKIISVNPREWGGGGEQKPVSSLLVRPPSTHICRAPAGTQALLGAEDPPPESQPWLRGWVCLAPEGAPLIPQEKRALALTLKDPEPRSSPALVCGSGALPSTVGAFISSSRRLASLPWAATLKAPCGTGVHHPLGRGY